MKRAPFGVPFLRDGERAPRERCLAETQRRRELDIFCGKAEFGFAARRSASSLGRRRACEFSSRQRLEYLSSRIREKGTLRGVFFVIQAAGLGISLTTYWLRDIIKQ